MTDRHGQHHTSSCDLLTNVCKHEPWSCALLSELIPLYTSILNLIPNRRQKKVNLLNKSCMCWMLVTVQRVVHFVMWFVIGVWSVVSILLSFLVSAVGQAETDLTTTGRLWSMHICTNELCGLTVFERVSQEWLSSRLSSRSRLFRYPKLSAMCW